MNANPATNESVSSDFWVVRYDDSIPPSDLLIPASANPQIAVPTEGVVWIRFQASESEAREIIATLSGIAYRSLPSGELCRPEDHVPTDALPETDWMPLGSQVKRQLPVAKFPESVCGSGRPVGFENIPLRLIPASQSSHPLPVPAEAIVARLSDLCDWVDYAGGARMGMLRWMVVGESALVMGHPLPPIAGKHYSKSGRILVPSGKWWSPDLPTTFVERLLDGPPGEDLEDSATLPIHLWNDDETVVRIPSDEFQSLRRAAVRKLTEG